MPVRLREHVSQIGKGKEQAVQTHNPIALLVLPSRHTTVTEDTANARASC